MGQYDWLWKSNKTEYGTVAGNATAIRGHLANKKIFIIGDSLHRQWAHSLNCLFQFKLGLPDASVEYCQIRGYVHFELWMQKCLQRARVEGRSAIVVINFGHWFDPSTLRYHSGEFSWREEYSSALKYTVSKLRELAFDRSRVWFRSTTPRFYLNGDWYDKKSSCGDTAANNTARWGHFTHHILPEMNVLLFNATCRGFKAPFKILDTAPVSLPRADASFDCTHFCIPGPMDTWTSMLLNQIAALDRARASDGVEAGRIVET